MPRYFLQAYRSSIAFHFFGETVCLSGYTGSMNSSAWSTEKFDQFGFKLANGEVQSHRFPDFSLTIPAWRFGEVGTLVATNQRLIFLVYGHCVGYTFNLTSVAGFNSMSHPSFSDNSVAFLEVSTPSGERFSIQGGQAEIAQLLTVVSAVASSQVVQAGGRARKKIIGAPKSNSMQVSDGPKIVGIGGIEQATHDSINKRQSAVTSALQDIDTLKSGAQKLKEIAAELSKASDKETTSEMSKICLAIGIQDPVSKKSGGSQFAKDLAKEFATSMNGWMAKAGVSILAIPEAYAAYNRLRGNDLISPNDLREAVQIIERGGFDIRVETIANLQVIVKKEASFDAVVKSLLDGMKDDSYITPMMIQTKSGLPNTIAKSYLLRAEQQGILARDESLAGLRYYKNIFSSFQPIKLSK